VRVDPAQARVGWAAHCAPDHRTHVHLCDGLAQVGALSVSDWA
jgi:hypothetical protein